MGTGEITIKGLELSKINNRKIKVINDWNDRVKVLYGRSNLLSYFEIKKPKPIPKATSTLHDFPKHL